MSSARMAVAAFALTMAPVVAHGLWRPLLAGLGEDSAGIAPRVTVAALLTAALVLLVGWLAPRRGPLPGAALGCLMAIALAAALGGGVSMALSVVAAGVLTALLAPWCTERAPRELAGLLTRHPIALAAWLVVSAGVVTKAALLSTFMGDPAYASYSLFPKEPFLVHHSCLTSAVHALQLHLAGVENIYDLAHAPLWETGPRTTPYFAPFHVDQFNYAPPYLLVPLALGEVAGGFYAQRAIFYGLNGLAVAAAVWRVACWVGGRRGAAALLLAPALWLTWGYALQLGNAHAIVASAAVVAMIAFESRRCALGGGLLAAAVLSKITPGVLGLVLLVQRRFKEALWTLGAGALITLLGLVALGTAPYAAWTGYMGPLLASGEALGNFTRDAKSIAANFSPFGIPFKLELLGLRLDAWAVASRIASVYTALVLALALVAARRSGDRGDRAITWLALLTLAAFRTTFAPPLYLGAFAWIVTLLAIELRGVRAALGLGALVASVGALSVVESPALLAGLSLGAQAAILGVLVWLVLRSPLRLENDAPLATGAGDANHGMSRTEAI